MYKSRSLWRYSLFQIPALLSVVCLVAVGVVAILGLGCPNFLVWLFLGLAWIALMWTLVLPLDASLRTKLNLKMGLAGRLAISHAVLWSLLTLAVLLLVLPPLEAVCK
ncbi:MAG: hypothetical protein HC866_04185 [Leptolyngbyaceae cyanobacterium RU_5_1]|nr:hypothetical protein [Leptolyngbyaceae cyanobacterium RU_5_1]